MYKKKTKPRSIMELLNRNLSERDVAIVVGCSRNTVAEVRELCRQQNLGWDKIKDMFDEQLYDILYPRKFKKNTHYVPVDYSMVLPLTSLTYMWTMFLSYLILKERSQKEK